MKIGILGAGNVGGALGQSWTRHGHEVFFGVRKPDSPEIHELLQRCGPRARAESIADAVRSGEVIVNALPWPATRPVIEKLDFEGRTLLDCSNPFKPDLSGLEIGTTTSAGEMVAEWSRSSKVVKIFNTTGFNNMTDPKIHGHSLTMLYCGDDAAAKNTAAQLARDIGFDPVDAGPLANARLLEALAMAWVWLAVRGGTGRDFGFQIVKR
jgi:8-hydroxy-5-deazaflavin:NADPH oxidoreductase